MIKLMSIVLLFSINALAGDLDKLVLGVSDKYNQASIKGNTEYYGVVLSDLEGNLSYTADKSVTGKEIVTFKFKRRMDQKVIAIWHTHGAKGKGKEYFSNYDTSAAKHFNVPIYMMDSTYTLRVYKPKDKTLSYSQARRRGLVEGMAKGSIIKQYIAGI